jgi:hypothetical protein
MSDKKKTRRPKAPQYKWAPGAVCVTLHSTDGSPVDPTVFAALEVYAEQLATENNLLVNTAKA